MMPRVYHFIVYRPRILLLLITLLTGFFAFYAREIRLDSSVESLLAKGDPEKAY